MAQATIFRGAIEFFTRLGIYDVVLPFLLIFTIVFAILEKTKVFGTMKVGDQTVPRKNLNAMASFVISLLVVASRELVAVVNESVANIVVLLLAVVSFLLLYGAFVKEGEPVFLSGTWKTAFMWVMLVGVVVIFLNAAGWLNTALTWLSRNINTDFVGSIILLVIIIMFIGFITKGEKPSKSKKSE